MIERLRIAVLGDPHIGYPADDRWDDVVADINSLAPTAVFVVGDLTGYGPSTGTSAAMRHAGSKLDGLVVPWYSVIGNTDLQAAEFTTDEEAVGSFLTVARRDSPWFRVDLGPLSVVGLSGTSFRRNSETHHEIVFEAEQLDWFAAQLDELANRPVFVIAHAPPIGSGLLTMPELHAHLGNAVVNQNHSPGRVTKIIWNHPNVLAWFSGHNHLGHCYRNAISVALGVHFIHAGAATETRDGLRHSRVVDIYPDRFEVLTFDHAVRRLDGSLTYSEPTSLAGLLAWRTEMKGRLYLARDPETMRQGPPLEANHEPGIA